MPGCNLLAAEPCDRLLRRRVARLFVAAREETSALPTALKGGVELFKLRR